MFCYHVGYSVKNIRGTAFVCLHKESELVYSNISKNVDAFHTWKAVGRVVGGRCQAQYATHAKPEAASASLGS